MNRQDVLIYDLCDEIDELKAAVKYWKQKFEEERAENIKATNERLEESKKGIANALLLCLSVKDNPDGSLSISKEDRYMLAENILSSDQDDAVCDATKAP
jgi:hypothetical protein